MMYALPVKYLVFCKIWFAVPVYIDFKGAKDVCTIESLSLY